MKNKRYFPPELFKSFLDDYSNLLKNNILGYSVKGLPIHELQVGFGKQKILMWSQMHGNESTTTKAKLTRPSKQHMQHSRRYFKHEKPSISSI